MSELKDLPKIDEFLADERVINRSAGVAPRRVTAIVRACVQRMREAIIGKSAVGCRGELFEAIMREVLAELDEYTAQRLIPVINATGIVVHTNLGRAVLSQKAAAHALELATGYNNLEYSTTTGSRRSRLFYIERLLCDLTGAEAALVVNNNAAAVFLALNTLCAGKEVLLSRGEVVEIGDSFRISEIIGLSGCGIKEVGTTNRTYISDYERNISPDTAVIAKIHTSNYKISGFTAEVSAKELAALGSANGICVLEDMGSGVMTDLRDYGLPAERTAADAIADGVDVITISGDKMLGGPQAGIILGKEKYLAPMKRNQLLRCLRIDKLSLAALEATLTEYLNKSPDIPVLKYIGQTPDTLKARAERLQKLLTEAAGGCTFRIAPHTAQAGGGALPSQQLQSWGVLVKSTRYSDNKLEALLRGACPPVIATLRDDGIMLDVIAVPDERFSDIAAAFASLEK